MKSAIFLFFACLLPTVGCSSRNPHTFNSATSTSSPKQLALDSEKTSAVEARLAFVKKQMSAHGYNPNLLIDGDDLYSLMLAVQNGKLTSEMLRGKHFFFKDNIGIDYGLGLGRFFICSDVIDVTDKYPVKDNSRIYKALYSNPSIQITASVVWYGTRPLEGQRLNTDYLAFVDVGSYESRGAGRRSEIIFFRPPYMN